MREGVRRLSVAVWWLSVLWLGGSIIYITFNDEPMGHDLSSSVVAKGMIVAPGLIGLIAGWVLEAYAEKP
jgi:hypothetical protein